MPFPETTAGYCDNHKKHMRAFWEQNAAVVKANIWVPRSLETRSKDIRRVGRIADQKPYLSVLTN
jgi:hypothetical protein